MNDSYFMNDTSFGKVALSKLSPVPENFRIYEAGWLGSKPSEFTVMEVKGAEFRAAKSVPYKGELKIKIPNTNRTVYVTKEEIAAYNNTNKV